MPFKQGEEVDRTPRFDGVNAELPDAFHNAVDAPTEIQKEKPIHRLMIFMACNGFSYEEIAKKVECAPLTVSRVLRQPWAQQMIQAEQRHAGMDEIRETFRKGAQRGYEKLLKLVDTSDTESVQADAAKYLVNRFYGQCTLPITGDTKPAVEMTDAELKASLDGALASEASCAIGDKEDVKPLATVL